MLCHWSHNINPTFDFNRMAIGYWASVAGETPIQPVRVFLTCERLAEIDPSQPRDQPGAFAIFDANLADLHEFASRAFDAGKLDDDKHEGQPVVTLRS
jgi:hypothetical protein